MKAIYPVLFTQTNDNVLIEVPDLEILTEGTDLADAINMARDAIGVTGISMQDKKEEIPQPSKMSDINLSEGTFYKEGDTVVSLVDIDFNEYRRKVDTKTVRRNVALPSWLDYEAEHTGINVSRVLQEALMSVLNVSRHI